MQEYLNLVDRGLEPSCKVSVKKIEYSPSVWLEWIELKETLAKFQAERGKQTSNDSGSDDMVSNAKRKWKSRKSNASPVEFCRRGLAGGNVWDSLADLLKIMKLRRLGAHDVREVREIVQHLFATHVDHLLFKLVDEIH